MSLKNVVIIGGASGGAQVARALEKSLPETHRLVLIESNEFAYWPIGALRAAVKPGFEDQVFASFEGFFGKTSRHIVLAGYSVTELNENIVKLDKTAPAPFNSDTISVEVGVIAAGSTYAIPMRPLSIKLIEAKQGLKNMQKEVSAAKHILIIGGGPVGVEFAGEVKAQHPNKKITLISSGNGLIEGFKPSLGKSLVNQLKDKNVNVRLNTSIELTSEHIEKSQRLQQDQPLQVRLSDGSEIKTDFLFIATGGKPNTSLVPQAALDNGKPSRIDVNPGTLRLNYPPLANKWFALGDATNAPGPKTFVNVTSQAPIIAAQVKSLITSGSASTQAYKGPTNVMVVVSGYQLLLW